MNIEDKDYRNLYSADRLHAHHLEGKDVTVLIEKIVVVELTNMTGKTEKKPQLHFKGKKLPLVINKTNGATIAKMHGKVVRDWIGKSITLYPTTTKFGRDTVECIRVREQKPS